MTSQKLFTSRAVRSGAAALVVGLAVVLSGCNSGGSPGPGGTSSPVAAETPTATATPAPTPTPSAVYKPADASRPAQNVPVPVLPEVAKAETKEGAEAFTKYWFSVLSYSYETGDTERLSALSRPDCVFCSALVDNIKTAWSDGKWISGGRIETPAVTADAPAGQPLAIRVAEGRFGATSTGTRSPEDNPPAPDQHHPDTGETT